MLKKVLVILIIIIPSLSLAAKYDGGVAVRLDGEQSTCINIEKHRISLHLRRLLLSKDSSWFSADKEVGLLLETAINAEKVNGEPAEKVSFPKLFKADISEFKEGIVSLLFEQRLLHRFNLSRGENLYTSVDLTFTVLKKKKKANFGVVLEQLDKVTKTIPGSMDPFTPAFKYFVDYTNVVVNESINSGNNVDDTLKDGQLVFSFSDTDKCTQDEEKTGAIAVIKSHEGNENEGIIDISKINEYCLSHTTAPSFSLQFGKKIQGACNGIKFVEVVNPYSLFILNAKPKKELVDRSRLEVESLNRCRLYGIDEQNCV